MRIPSLLAVAFSFAVAIPAGAQVPAGDAQGREEAGRRLEAFLLEPDADGKSFVAASVDRAALGAAAREWGRKAEPRRVSAFLAVSAPSSRSEARLRRLMERWTGAAQIKPAGEAVQAAAFFADAAEKAARLGATSWAC